MSCIVAYGETSSESSDNEDADQIKDDSKNELTDHRLKNAAHGTKRSVCSDENLDEPPLKKITEDKIEHILESGRERLSDDKSVKDKLCLPPAIHSMFNCDNASWTDNPAEHDFRIRSFPHVEGNWATHVYIPVQDDGRIANFVGQVLKAFGPMKFHPFPEFHISLSRTVVIRYHWIESLVDSLRKNVSSLNRTFVCLELSTDDTLFLDYVKAVDKSYAEFKLPSYYKDPSFHISIGWCLEDVRDRISEDTLCKAKEMLASFCATNPELSVIFARHICCQSGNKSFLIPLMDADA